MNVSQPATFDYRSQKNFPKTKHTHTSHFKHNILITGLLSHSNSAHHSQFTFEICMVGNIPSKSSLLKHGPRKILTSKDLTVEEAYGYHKADPWYLSSLSWADLEWAIFRQISVKITAFILCPLAFIALKIALCF